MVHRTYACGVCGFSARMMVAKGSPILDFDCPDCAKAIAEGEAEVARLHEISPLADPAARSDNIGSPLPMSARMKGVKKFEKVFTRPHFEDGSPLMTNLKDNNREGDVAAITDTNLARQMMGMGGGWGVGGPATADTSGQSVISKVPANGSFMGRQAVNLQGDRLPSK